MNRYTISLLTVIILAGTNSCKKQGHQLITPTPPYMDSTVTITPADYTALKPGNYWIYQNYHLDSAAGEAHPMGTYDSCYVEKDTMINGHVYHKYWEAIFDASPGYPQYNYSYLRDSSGYTVTWGGLVQMTTQDFSSVLRTYLILPGAGNYDTLVVTEQMRRDTTPTTVNAGTFETITSRRIFHLPPTEMYGPTREYNTMYARGIGIVRQTKAFYLMLPDVWEWRLERYHLE